MKQKFIEWFTKNNNGCSPAMEDDRSFVYEMTQHMFEAYQAGVAEGEAKCAALAAENAGLKNALEWLYETVSSESVSIPNEKYSSVTNAAQVLSETPATEAVLAEVRAQGADECVRQLVTSDDDDFSDAPNICAMVAHQLRKGVQS
ncbi:hypothetical protein [Enterobacter hormaechei]|uniref:hypothetical protein n=1 Tax=Enterobacter hormaechei TaxID=158836 RepID=UPI003F424302